MIGTEPKPDLARMFARHGGTGKPVVGQPAICYGTDEAACLKLAHEQFAWSVGGWKLQAELPNPVNFEAFAATVTEDQVARKVPCGPKVEPVVEAV